MEDEPRIITSNKNPSIKQELKIEPLLMTPSAIYSAPTFCYPTNKSIMNSTQIFAPSPKKAVMMPEMTKETTKTNIMSVNSLIC